MFAQRIWRSHWKPVSRVKLRYLVLCAHTSLWAACSGGSGPFDDEQSGFGCIVPSDSIFDTGGPSLPTLDNPSFVRPGEPGSDFVEGEDRILGIVLEDQAYALPHKILNWHEVVNLELEGAAVTVTYCTLTGSGLVFRRGAVSGRRFRTTPLLFRSNLVMFERNDPGDPDGSGPGSNDLSVRSIWVQMLGQAVCGFRSGTELEKVRVMEARWDAWLSLHPETLLLSSRTGYDRNYSENVYAWFEVLDEHTFGIGFGEPDPRRLPKERVLGIPTEDGGGLGLPFLALNASGAHTAVNDTVDGRSVAIFWSLAFEGAMAYEAVVDGTELSFEGVDDRFVDRETGSTWSFDGRAIAGPLEGTSLTAVTDAYVAYWFAWAAFQPYARLWEGT